MAVAEILVVPVMLRSAIPFTRHRSRGDAALDALDGVDVLDALDRVMYVVNMCLRTGIRSTSIDLQFRITSRNRFRGTQIYEVMSRLRKTVLTAININAVLTCEMLKTNVPVSILLKEPLKCVRNVYIYLNLTTYIKARLTPGTSSGATRNIIYEHMRLAFAVLKTTYSFAVPRKPVWNVPKQPVAMRFLVTVMCCVVLRLVASVVLTATSGTSATTTSRPT